MSLPQRKNPRLQTYDYASTGAYFITICAHEKQKLFSEIIPSSVGRALAPAEKDNATSVGRALAPAENRLFPCGIIAEQQMRALSVRYPCLEIPYYVIMPNHIHAIFVLNLAAGASARPTIPDTVRTYKSLTARECHAKYGIKPLFQTSFHDHIIRNENDYTRIAEYIENNPAKWCDDCFYV